MIWKVLFIILIILLYITSINLLSPLISNIVLIKESSITERTNKNINRDALLSVNVLTDVSMQVTIIRKRIYGTIIEELSYGDSNLYLFNLINLPLYLKGFNLMFIHLSFLFLLFLCFFSVWLYRYISHQSDLIR